jgi:hypothetical protein
MKGNPAVPGGPLKSKPTRDSTLVVQNRVGFFFACCVATGDCRRKDTNMLQHFTPFLADYIWIGGGTLGTILVIVVIVLLVRKV